MKPIILKSHEVIHLRDTGSVIAWRVAKPKPLSGPNGEMVPLGEGSYGLLDGVLSGEWKCPYGRTGEERWVKETFVDGYPSDCGDLQMFDEDGNEHPKHVWYRSDDKLVSNLGAPMEEWLDDMGAPLENIPWRSSIHMPRWASRFTVTLDVGLKRIQEVDAFTARSSGVVVSRCACEVCSNGSAICPADASEYALGMRTRVDVSNPGSWDRNDYFWKITCTLKK